MSTEITPHSARYWTVLAAPWGHHEERGGSLIEYCLLVGLIALVTIGALTAFGAARDDVWLRAASSISAP